VAIIARFGDGVNTLMWAPIVISGGGIPSPFPMVGTSPPLLLTV